MERKHFSILQSNQSHPKVAEQNIVELTNLAHKLIEFEKVYLNTHGERTPVFRVLSMINNAIAYEVDIITRKFADGNLQYKSLSDEQDKIAF